MIIIVAAIIIIIGDSLLIIRHTLLNFSYKVSPGSERHHKASGKIKI